VAGSLHKAVIN